MIQKSHVFRYILRADELWCGSISYVLRLDFLHYDQNLDLSDAVFCQKKKTGNRNEAVFFFFKDLEMNSAYSKNNLILSLCVEPYS